MTQPIRYQRFITRNTAAQTGLLSEFTALRSEILARHTLRNQVLLLLIVGLGVFLKLPASGVAPYSPALFYPIFIAFLAVGWSQQDIRIGDIGYYIAQNIEPLVDGLNWEGHLHQTRIAAGPRTFFKPWVRITEFYALGVFGGAQLIVLAISLPRVICSQFEIILLTLDILSIIITIYAVTRRAAKYP